MNIERLEKIKELTEEIDAVIEAEMYDNTGIHLKNKLKEFITSLEFELKDELWEEYNKKHEKKV